MTKKKNKKKKSGKEVLVSATRYQQFCDNHPKRRAVMAYREADTGNDVGRCQACWDREREAAIKEARRAARRQPRSKRRRGR